MSFLGGEEVVEGLKRRHQLWLEFIFENPKRINPSYRPYTNSNLS